MAVTDSTQKYSSNHIPTYTSGIYPKTEVTTSNIGEISGNYVSTKD